MTPGSFGSFNLGSLAELNRTEGRRRWDFRRGESPAARGKWGKMERGSRATFGWPWLVGRGSEEAGPRRGAAGGGSARRRPCSGEGMRERMGRRASGGRWGSISGVGSGRGWPEKGLRGEPSSAAMAMVAGAL